MTRPCAHPTGPPRPDVCRVCWLYAHDEAYNRLYGGDGSVGPAPAGDPWVSTRPAPAVPAHGPGTELKLLLTSLGAEACLACLGRAAQMNLWGVAACRQHRDEIAGWLRDGAEAAGWAARLKAAALALATGLAFRLDPGDLYGGLVDEAIRRAEAAEP